MLPRLRAQIRSPVRFAVCLSHRLSVSPTVCHPGKVCCGYKEYLGRGGRCRAFLISRKNSASTDSASMSVVPAFYTQLPAHTSPGHPVSWLLGWGDTQQCLSPALNGPSPGQTLPWTTLGRVVGDIDQSRLNLGDRVILWFLYEHRCKNKNKNARERLDDF